MTDFTDLVVDSAGYTAQTLASFSGDQRWISRVPESLSECKALVESGDALTPINSKTSCRAVLRGYVQVQQRWQLVRSQEAYEREMKTLIKKTFNGSHKETKAFEKFCREDFAFESDASKALYNFKKNTRFIEVNDTLFIVIPKYTTPSRPAEGQRPDLIIYRSVPAFIAQARTKGRYVLATNELDEQRLSDIDILENYKCQSFAEKGFRFLKDPWFVASNFFVKKLGRIEALTFIMTLYAAFEYQLRQQLEEHNETIPNQVGKPSARPTARRVFSLFRDIHVLYMPDLPPQCLNLKDVHLKILALLGQRYKKYYLQV